MDWLRYMKAMDARGMEGIEQQRSAQIAGTIKADDITTDEWEQIQEHDQLVAPAD